MRTYSVELSREEINVIRNGLRFIVKSEAELSESAKNWYTKVQERFDKIAEHEFL